MRAPGGPADGEAGQIGVGTLIVLIAAILVATATAGVLLQTTGVLRSQSDAASEQVREELTPPLSVVAVTGGVNASASPIQVETLAVVVRGVDGERADLAAAQVRLSGDLAPETLSYDATSASAGETFAVEVLADPDGSAPTLDGEGDRFRLVVPTTGIEAGARVRIAILLEGGDVVRTRVTVPQSLDGRDRVVLS